MPARKTDFERFVDNLAKTLSKRGWDTFQISCLILSILFLVVAYFIYYLAGSAIFWALAISMLLTDAGCIWHTVVKAKKSKAINVNKELLVLKSGIKKIDRMNPYKFEEFVGQLYEADGFIVEVTKKSGDNGGDVIAVKGDQRICVQVKHYSVKVPYKAVQEVISAMLLYRCNECAIVTNSQLTRQARQNAKKMNVDVIDRDKLIDWINRTQYKTEVRS